jgi:O-antigen/teichoic acid export membrane protein
MRISESLKTETARHSFEAAFVILLLLMVPFLPLGKYGGGIATLACAVIGLTVYFVSYRERLRNRHLLKTAALAAAAVAVIAIAVAFLNRWRWP